MKVFFLLFLTTLLFAAPKKKAPVVTNDEDFVPLKKSAPKIEVPKEEPPKSTPLVEPEVKVEKKQVEKEVTPSPSPKVEEKPKVSESEISEVLISKNYLQVTQLDQMNPYVEWDSRNGKSLYIPEDGEAYILLLGKMKDKYSLSINDKFVPLMSDGNFEYKLVVPSEPTTMNYTVKKPDGRTESFKVQFTWIKNPGSIRVKVKEGNETEKTIGFSGNIKLAASVQLIKAGEQVQQVETVFHKKAALRFKITVPETEEKLESWTLTIKNSKKDIYAQRKKNGSPPKEVDWNEIVPDVLPAGNYSYRVTLYTKTGVFEGPLEKFEAVEGVISIKHTAAWDITLEPKEEIGYLTYKNNNSFDTSSLYVGTELPLLLRNRYILRPGGMLALPTANPENAYYSARALLGVRLIGGGKKFLFLNAPYEMQLDVLLGLTRFSLSSRSNTADFNHLTLALQPDLVISGQQYITPLFEYSADSSFKSMRLSMGMIYQFYVRAWSLKWGMGAVYDNLFQDSIEANKYSLFRVLSSFQFQL